MQLISYKNLPGKERSENRGVRQNSIEREERTFALANKFEYTVESIIIESIILL